MIAENLFYNVPARKKFMRSRPAELRFLREVFLRAALSSPGVSFTLTVDGRRQNVFPAAEDRGERIGQVYGEAVRKHLLEERLTDVRVEVDGYLSGPGFSRPSRSLQLLFVNNRHVDHRALGFLLTRSYESLLRRGEHPAALIFITIEPTLVDVNVHPAKREVRFFDQSYINGLIMNLAKKALGSRAHRVDTGLFAGTVSPEHPRDAVMPARGDYEGDDIPASGREAAAAGTERLFPGATGGLVSGGRSLYEAAETGEAPPMLGVIFDTYILAEEGGSLVIIDYHAAHERFIFDRLMAGDDDGGTQGLIFPHPVDLTPLECALVMDNLAHFAAAGFEVEMIGEDSVAVRGVPAAARAIDLDAFFRDMLDSLDSPDGRAARTDWKKLIAEKAACHAAMRAGDGLSTDDARMIAAEALSGRHELRCPHGRPYLFRLGKDDIEKMFRRK